MGMFLPAPLGSRRVCHDTQSFACNEIALSLQLSDVHSSEATRQLLGLAVPRQEGASLELLEGSRIRSGFSSLIFPEDLS